MELSTEALTTLERYKVLTGLIFPRPIALVSTRSNNGVASWYDFAIAIQEEALAAGLLQRAIPVRPISTEAYPLPARRPVYSVLDVSDTETLLGVTYPHWRISLRSMLQELK